MLSGRIWEDKNALFDGDRTLRIRKLRYVFVAIWVLFTVSLTGWWIYFGLSQVDRLLLLDHQTASELVRYQRMLVWEGCALIFSLVVGGLSLTYLIYKEMRESRRVQEFFAAFSHEIKTPLAGVKLQTEVLGEQLSTPEARAAMARIEKEVGRLALQLENSLFLAQPHDREVFLQDVSLRDSIRAVEPSWPELKIDVNKDARIKADSRALESVLSNIFANAVSHGRSSRVSVSVEQELPELVRLSINDDGVGFKGDPSRLGEPFSRQYSGSGSGLGLFLVRKLVQEMGGRSVFLTGDRGFTVELHLQGVA